MDLHKQHVSSVLCYTTSGLPFIRISILAVKNPLSGWVQMPCLSCYWILARQSFVQLYIHSAGCVSDCLGSPVHIPLLVSFASHNPNHFIFIFIYLFIFKFWPHCVSCGILLPQPRIDPASPALGAWSLNHWTTRAGLLWPFQTSSPLYISGSNPSRPPCLSLI